MGGKVGGTFELAGYEFEWERRGERVEGRKWLPGLFVGLRIAPLFLFFCFYPMLSLDLMSSL